jgi:hypothetical protein
MRLQNKFLPQLVTTALTLGSCHIYAAELGEYLDKGAKKLGKTEQMSMASQARLVTGETFNGTASISLAFEPDGTFSGTVTVIKGQYKDAVSKSKGTWTVDDNGKFCMKEHLIDWNRYNSYCYFSFALGDQLVLSLSDTDRSAKAMLRPKPTQSAEAKPLQPNDSK